MENVNERPICHRSEDLVTYLYNESSEADARDFADHVERCDACRAELAVFRQVHQSILLWRNEALGSAFSPIPQAASTLTVETLDSTQFVQHERKLSALAALREFFSVSPLWLRSATAFAALLLCVLAMLAISRSWNRPAQVASDSAEPKRYTETELNNEVAKQVEKQVSDIKRSQNSSPAPANVAANKMQIKSSAQQNSRRQLASNSAPSRSQRPRGLTRQEREQLAADLRLVPGRDEEERPFVFPDEP